MSDIKLTCAETPLWWPTSVSTSELNVCGSCGILVTSPNPGQLKIGYRELRDGVSIEESPQAGADYRGQRYTYEEAIFHSPGLHIFPGQTSVYAGEYHIHMRSISEPVRYLTLVIPIGISDPNPTAADDKASQAYFAAIAIRPDATAKRPTLESLMAALDGPVVQYQGPDIRKRVHDTSGGAMCTSTDERQFLLVTKPAKILATDLGRIPSLDNTTSDPRYLPAPGVVPTIKAVSRDRLVRVTVLAKPGILYPKAATVAAPTSTEFECKPVSVLNGVDVVDISGKSVNIKKLLGLVPEDAVDSTVDRNDALFITIVIISIAMGCGILVGILLADFLATRLWRVFFTDNALIKQWEPLKAWIFIALFILTIFFGSSIADLLVYS